MAGGRLSPASAPRLAIVVKGFPRLSETFVARELAALESRGVDFTLHVLRRPGSDAKLVDNAVRARPNYLPEYLHEAPMRVMHAFASARRLPGFAAAWTAFRHDWPRDAGRARLRRLGQAGVLAMELPPCIRHIHAHFAHSPTSVVRYAAKMRGLSFSISAHAKDIWTAPDWDLAEKLADAAFVAVCNQTGQARLASLGDRNKIHLVHHGLPHANLKQRPYDLSRDGRDAKAPVRMVCVARAVEKKGLGSLLDALAQIPKEVSFKLDHIGGGPLLEPLKARAQRLGIGDRVMWLGSRPHNDVLKALDESELFVLSSAVAADGDRDGIPNAVLEAQGRGLAVLSTRTGGVAEVVEDRATGRLVDADDPGALARALLDLIRDPAERARLGASAFAQVRDRFDAESGYDRIVELLRERTD